MIEMTGSTPILGYVVIVVPLVLIALWAIRSVLAARSVEKDQRSDEDELG
ncbi:hypothetical protein ACFSGX_10420 [Sphingomonas arantia]|uniref:Heme exporter protein D n=1 Tax=Sphingomonas arantia TaxID=1460676 RepID=A0ABW4TWU8_9SPHN